MIDLEKYFKKNDLIDFIKNLEGKRLDDKSIRSEPFKLGIEKPFSFEELGATFTIDVSASGEIQVINSPDDKDDDHIIGVPSKDEKDVAKLEPQIEYSNEWAWVKYGLNAGLKGGIKDKSGIELKSIGFDLSAAKNVTLNSYRKHERSNDSTAEKDVLSDLNSFKFVTSLEDILALKIDEALSMQVGGFLKGGISLKWADIFTGNLGQLGKLIGVEEVIKIEVGASAEVSFNWSLEDDFVLVFSRVDDDKFRLGVKKARSKKMGNEISFGLSAKFADEDAIAEVLDNVYEGLVGEKLTKVEEILAKVNPEKFINDQKIGDNEKDIIIKVMERLKLNHLTDILDLLTEKLDKLKKDVKSAIEKIAKTKVELGFSYEYNRIETNATLLQAILNKKAVEKYHKSLIKQQLDGLLNDIRNNGDGVVLERFLNEKSLEIKEAWGASLGIGKWTLSGKDFKKIKSITRENINGNKQIIFLGTRGYEDRIGDKIVTFSVDFNAEMKRFSRFSEPFASEFDYDFYLLWRWQKPKIKDLPVILDHAALWKAFSTDEEGEYLAKLEEELHGKDDFEISCHLQFEPHVFEKLLPFISKKDNHQFAQALGAAMPFMEEYSLRRFVDLREKYYGPLWKSYLEQWNIMDENFFAKLAGDNLKKINKKIARKERDLWKKLLPQTFAGIISLNNTGPLWNTFCRGAEMLADAVFNREKCCDVINDSWELMNDFCEVAFHVRAIGAYLLNIAENQLGSMDQICRVLRIDDKDISKTIICTKT